MTKLNREEVLHIAKLCRMSLSSEEIERFSSQISSILENFEVLKEVNTSNVLPTAHPVPLRNVFREDEIAPCLPQAEVLANAPKQEEGYFRVKAVLE